MQRRSGIELAALSKFQRIHNLLLWINGKSFLWKWFEFSKKIDKKFVLLITYSKCFPWFFYISFSPGFFWKYKRFIKHKFLIISSCVVKQLLYFMWNKFGNRQKKIKNLDTASKWNFEIWFFHTLSSLH